MTSKIDKTNYYQASFEVTKEIAEEFSANGRSTLTIGKGKSKRYFVVVLAYVGNCSGMEMNLSSKGYEGTFHIIHHLGKFGEKSIVKTFEI